MTRDELTRIPPLLTHRDLWEDVADQVIGAVLHAPHRTGGADARLAGEGHQPLETAVWTARSGWGLCEQLAAYPWPGNVRELENALENLVALSDGGQLDLSLLPSPGPAPAHPGPATMLLKPRVEAYERGLIVEALRAARGNRSEAARVLGISRVTLHDKLKKYALAKGEEE